MNLLGPADIPKNSRRASRAVVVQSMILTLLRARGTLTGLGRELELANRLRAGPSLNNLT